MPSGLLPVDLLWLDGKDLRDLPLLERKKILRSILPQKSSWIGYVNFIGHTRARRLFELVKAKDLEDWWPNGKTVSMRPRLDGLRF
jgi:ATP-dependent DNA ligase